jgi:hypothetical protein
MNKEELNSWKDAEQKMEDNAIDFSNIGVNCMNEETVIVNIADINKEVIRNYIDSIDDGELLSHIVLDASKRLIDFKCNDKTTGIILMGSLNTCTLSSEDKDIEPQKLKMFKVTIES